MNGTQLRSLAVQVGARRAFGMYLGSLVADTVNTVLDRSAARQRQAAGARAVRRTFDPASPASPLSCYHAEKYDSSLDSETIALHPPSEGSHQEGNGS